MKPRYVAEPHPGGCWAQREVYIGQLFGAAFVQCTKRHRPGFLTCTWHKAWEGQARRYRDWKTKHAGSAGE